MGIAVCAFSDPGGLLDVKCGIHQSNMRKSLRKIPHHLASCNIGFFCEQAQIVSQIQ